LLKINPTALGPIAAAWLGSACGWWPAIAVPDGHIAPTAIYQAIDSNILLLANREFCSFAKVGCIDPRRETETTGRGVY
jgi:hypothetical protein